MSDQVDTVPVRPEERARRAWERQHGSLAQERDNWRRIAFGSLALASVTIAFGIWAAVRSEYVPYIVAVDTLGRPQPVLSPRQIRDWPDPVIRYTLSSFVRDWRSVSTDRSVMEGRLRSIQYFLEQNSAADRKIIEWARDPATSPFRTAETYSVDIVVASVVLVGGRSWLVEWTETRRDRSSGQSEPIQRYQATFVLGQRTVRDDRLLLENPLGMIIEDFDLVRLS
ncbi:hypothetical protein GTA62_18490 [Roseobacter sp. HKCCD9010]|uniref:VirB8/TrbF family protein n=1 Tax=unclassified Roseobacter TaxID=196798 RepID=UPI001491EB55|nr:MULTISPECIES: VirB8/TrbF family protein [unclassified Roseobacter]MBF9051908.1 hypothetical protein [Rhodobacterales bacterium HKCCD4356]NNV13901.1 hypothetical protein [Roseobacter sp. HKCCD7357]NNV18073.1 hypothetical protein [Roseobacter sp. HKCCD8768]NNV27533.1 hypothetical protein [Roseobacter sp. HKCCD8192]NNV31799.1 hypothetical protein [Roseobacter sp. HKCCD9061]